MIAQTSVLIIIIIIFLLVIINNCSIEPLIVKPDYNTKIKYTEEILSNKNLFTGALKLENIKNKFTWMDAITYEDIRSLIRNNTLTRNNIIKILS